MLAHLTYYDQMKFLASTFPEILTKQCQSSQTLKRFMLLCKKKKIQIPQPGMKGCLQSEFNLGFSLLLLVSCSLHPRQGKLNIFVSCSIIVLSLFFLASYFSRSLTHLLTPFLHSRLPTTSPLQPLRHTYMLYAVTGWC